MCRRATLTDFAAGRMIPAPGSPGRRTFAKPARRKGGRRMNITLGLFALSLLGAEGPEPREAAAITYDVRVITMNGLEWRGAYFSRLQTVASQGGVTVWTTGHET